MTRVAQTLWDLFRSAEKKKNRENQASPDPSQNGKLQRVVEQASARNSASKANGKAKTIPMQQRYDALVVEMKHRYSIRVRKWRSSTSGCAWEIHYDTGDMARLIESPYPRGPMSCAVFLHEIGHHAIGFQTYRPRCLEEYHAWRWALETMRERDFNVTAAVEKRMAESLRHAVRKAKKRGLRRVPSELFPYV